jgi:type I restriction enzyme R subunit
VDRAGHVTLRVEDHRPIEAGDLAGAQPGLDRQQDHPVENLIRNDIDDFFFEELRGRRGLALDPSVLDGIVDEMLGTARTRLAL